MKRILLFLATNLAVILVLTIVLRLLGIDDRLTAQGYNVGSLLIGAAVFGFGGALISLALSKWMAKRMMGVRVIVEPINPMERLLIKIVRTQAHAVGIGMPEVGIFDAPEPNAFATGARRNHALIAVSSGLLNSMQQQEIEAVLGHEVTHIANGNMVTLTLVQGVVNTFVIFLARLIGNLVDRTIFRSEDGRGPAFFATVLVTEIVLGVLASVIVLWFSRQREFRADHGGARLAGTGSMIAALQQLHAVRSAPLPGQLRSFGIAASPGSALTRLFMSHPPVEERIAALRASREHVTAEPTRVPPPPMRQR